MKIMGIDPGNYSALSILEDKTVLSVDHIDLAKVKNNKLLEYYNFMYRTIGGSKPDIVYCEEPFMPPKFPQAGKSMNKKLAIIELVCQQLSIKCTFINPSVVKKTLTGHGKTEKDELAKTVLSLVDTPKVVESLIYAEMFDETDSIAIALAGYRTGGI